MRFLTMAAFTTVALVLGAAPAWAQGGGKSGNVLDTLGDLLRGAQSVRGRVVVLRDNELVLRGQEGKTYVVNTAAMESDTLAKLAPGQTVSVKLRPGQHEVLIADTAKIEAGAPQSFQKIDGTVQSVSGERVSFRTKEGLVVPVDLAQVAGRAPKLKADEPATLYYESQGQSVVGVWVEPKSSAAAATGGAASPATGEYRRLHGYVESVGVDTMALKSDDGRRVTVDTSRVGDDTRRALRPGDLVSVVGKAGTGEPFVAELIQNETKR